MVLRGNNVKDDSRNYAVLTEQGASASTYDGGKSLGRCFKIVHVFLCGQAIHWLDSCGRDTRKFCLKKDGKKSSDVSGYTVIAK